MSKNNQLKNLYLKNSACILLLVIFSISCKPSKTKIHPVKESITESVYASGIIKSQNQYQLFSTVNGIIEQIYVSEGDSVKKGQPVLLLSNETSRLNKENAALAAEYSNYQNNQSKLNELRINIDLARAKMQNDSLLFSRQKDLYSKQVGSKVELEQRELAFANSKTQYESAQLKYNDLDRQLKFSSVQSGKNLLISLKAENDYLVKSEINGIIYNIAKKKGELVTTQTALGVIGEAGKFILEMQIDEYDILKVKPGMKALVTMDSYKGKVFEATVEKVYPYMNERTKTFLVDASFDNPPATLYPNITFEANIIIHVKENALTIPRNYLLNDSTVVNSNGDKIFIRTGLKDYKKIEIISGLSESDELIKPVE